MDEATPSGPGTEQTTQRNLADDVSATKAPVREPVPLGNPIPASAGPGSTASSSPNTGRVKVRRRVRHKREYKSKKWVNFVWKVVWVILALVVVIGFIALLHWLGTLGTLGSAAPN